MYLFLLRPFGVATSEPDTRSCVEYLMQSPKTIGRSTLSFLTGLPTTTGEGRIFLVGVVAIGFLATASDRNYVILILGFLLAVVLVSVIFSALNLRGIEFHRSLPDAVIAGESFSVRVKLTNRRRWLPARSVLVWDALQSSRAGADSRCYAPTIPAGGHVTFVYTARIRRRGAYNITNALLVTGFPFGLFQKRILAKFPSRIVVYPRMERVRGGRLPMSGRALAAPTVRAARRGGGEEFRALREYRPGDDPRRIAWRVSARQRKLVLREMEQENRGRVAVLLSTALTGVPMRERTSSMERAVTLAASLVSHFQRERRPFLFAAPGLTTEVFQRAEHVHVCLAWLATIRPDTKYDPEALLREVGPRRLRGRDVLLITAGRASVERPLSAGYRLHLYEASSMEGKGLLRGRR